MNSYLIPRARGDVITWREDLTRALDEVLSDSGSSSLLKTILDSFFLRLDLEGTKDGDNRTFTSPYPVRLDIRGYPQAKLIWRRAEQIYTTDLDHVAPGLWGMSDSTTFIMGNAPNSEDVLYFAPFIADVT